MLPSFLKTWIARARAYPVDAEDPERLLAARAQAAERARTRLAAHAWPDALLEALAVLRRDGRQAYLVGGTVRDVLLGRAAAGPYDAATDLPPNQVARYFARVVPIGIEHGTVLILTGELAIECTTFRTEAAYLDGRRPESVTFGTDPIADLGRRDLTVNALAFDPATGVLLDPHGGALDLERGVLRAVGDPAERFREDALRPLRVARFAATLEMPPEPRTRAALSVALDRATGVSWERVRDELEKMMAAEHPSIGLELLRESGWLERVLPELQRCHGVPQNRWHAYDVYEHSLHTVDAAPRDKRRVRWAALLHDIGKPSTRVERDGEGTFYDHQIVGAAMADVLLARLRFPAVEREAIVHLVREHMFDYRPEWTDAAVRRWVRRVGVDAIADLFDLRIADYVGNGLRAGFPAYLDEMRARIERVLAASSALGVGDLAVDGRDVMRVLGVPEGRVVGETLARLVEEVLERPEVNRRETLLARLEEVRRERAEPAARSAPAPRDP